ncbi:hypothetical protein BU15DRAFT_60471 [Melanogaster broomeanus]|nr:hypothetical protein BU15DRAFT_60471 [Melanogaster broomeanus]
MPHPPSHHTTTNFLSQEEVASEERGPDDDKDPQSMSLEGERGHESSDNAGASPRPAEGDKERQPAKPKPPDVTDVAATPRTQDDSGGDVGVHRTHVVPRNPQMASNEAADATNPDATSAGSTAPVGRLHKLNGGGKMNEGSSTIGDETANRNDQRTSSVGIQSSYTSVTYQYTEYSTGYMLLSLISSLVYRAIRDTLPHNPEAQERILGASLTAFALADVIHMMVSWIGLPEDLRYSPLRGIR